MTLAPPIAALLRNIPDSYRHCLRERPAEIDVALARRQHDAYARALADLGVEVIRLPAEEWLPDGVFIEDAAVITGAHALATRPGAPSRRDEVASVAAALAAWCTVHEMGAPATLEGGDVMRLGRRLVVGRSRRTNLGGIARLAEVAALDDLEVVPIEVARHMHLKGVMTALDEHTVVVDATELSGLSAALTALGVRVVATPESNGANVLSLGEIVLVPEACPRTAELVAAAGHRVVLVPGSELHKGDGRLTCLSLRVPQPGCWAA